jgi:hypothetical protein
LAFCQFKISEFFKIFQNHECHVAAPSACCPIANKNPASLCWPLAVFCLFGEKIGNNYILMKKSLKISFPLFKVFTADMGK